jgi:hypothetical protein
LALRGAVAEIDELLSADENHKELAWRGRPQADFYGLAYSRIPWV